MSTANLILTYSAVKSKPQQETASEIPKLQLSKPAAFKLAFLAKVKQAVAK